MPLLIFIICPPELPCSTQDRDWVSEEIWRFADRGGDESWQDAMDRGSSNEVFSSQKEKHQSRNKTGGIK